MKDKFFFPLAAICALAIIAIAMAPHFLHSPIEVVGQRVNGAIVLSAAELNQFKPETHTRVTPAPGPSGLQFGPRLASELAVAGNEKKGAKLPFSMGLSKSLENANIAIIAKISPIRYTPAKTMALGIYNGNEVNWVEVKLPPKLRYIRFNFAPSAKAPEGIIIAPALEGEAHGIEVQKIVIIAN